MRTRFHSAYSGFVIAVLVAFFAPSDTARAAFEKEEAEINSLMDAGKYYSAASAINSKPELLAQPRFVRLFTRLLVTKYVFTINFSIFALKDLEKGERVENLRGKPGSYQMVGGPLDNLLYEHIKKNPDSPELNYAVGEYLSRGEACGCRQDGPIKDLSGDESKYFLKAYKAGVADAWSLFRLGLRAQYQNQLDDAVAYYKKALTQEPGHVDANYNMAAVYYMRGDLKAARSYIEKTVGKYDSADLNADTYAMQGMILGQLNEYAPAERSLDEALKLKRWHPEAFKNLLSVYRVTKQDAKYVQRVQDFIALDYGNTFTFNAYVDFLQNAKPNDQDRKVEQQLLALNLNEPQQVGALYFNLARMAELRNDNAEALNRYRKSLAALKKLKEPPAGAIPAMTQRIGELEKNGSK